MFDANRILGQLLDTPSKQGFAGGVAGGLLGGMLTSKSGRKMGKKALKYGALAAVAAVAYQAWQRHQAAGVGSSVPGGAGSSAAAAPPPPAPAAETWRPPPPASGFLPPPSDTAARRALGMTLVRAMIAAARADGKLEPAETQTILARLEESDLTAEEKGVLVNELSRPADPETLAHAVRTPQEATEVYVASLMAIEVDTAEERAYLARLADRLGLEPDLARELHRQVEAA